MSKDLLREDAFDANENVQEMLLLAERLREAHGDLDDDAIIAVSETSGIPVEYVRVALSRLPEKSQSKLNFVQKLQRSFRALDPQTRRTVLSFIIGAAAGKFALFQSMSSGSSLPGIISLIVLGVGFWNVALSQDRRTATISGAVLGAAYFIAQVLVGTVVGQETGSEFLLIPYIGFGALIGSLLFTIVTKNRNKLGIRDPQEERQELLKQLHDIQERLRTGEQAMCFLSLDVVGSTRMKEQADQLNVEYTFTEYHKFVEMATRKFTGKVHSTAGDGIICAFEHPQQAFAAARYIQSGLVELNTHRNRIGIPLSLRAGIHTGTVNIPPGGDVTKVNFAHVIDIAAHLQKVAPVGGIAVSVEAATRLHGGPTAVGAGEVTVENVKARVWLPKKVVGDMPAGAPPPLPEGNPGTS